MRASLPARIEPEEGRIAPAELMPAESHLRPSRGAMVIRTLTWTGALAVITIAFAIGSPFIGIFAVLLVLIGTGSEHQRETNAKKRNREAIGLLEEGRIEEAGRIFEELAREREGRLTHPLYVYNRGVASLLEGRPRRALSIFNAVDRSGAFSRPFMRHNEGLLFAETAACLALLGELREAQRYRDRAARRLADGHDGRLVFVDAVLAARKGDFREGVQHVSARWDLAEEVLKPPTVRALAVVAAYMLERAGRGPAEANRILREARPLRRRDLRWMVVEWPELAAWLNERGYDR